jgi:hypothetical protein
VFDNQHVSGESADQAAATPPGGEARVTLNCSKLFVEFLQFCPLAGADFLDPAFYDHQIALPLSLESAGLSIMWYGTDQNLKLAEIHTQLAFSTFSLINEATSKYVRREEVGSPSIACFGSTLQKLGGPVSNQPHGIVVKLRRVDQALHCPRLLQARTCQ